MQRETHRCCLTNVCYSHVYENESTFGHELNLDQSWFELSKCRFDLNKCNSNSNLIQFLVFALPLIVILVQFVKAELGLILILISFRSAKNILVGEI